MANRGESTDVRVDDQEGSILGWREEGLLHIASCISVVVREPVRIGLA